jgi:hypothetical protein
MILLGVLNVIVGFCAFLLVSRGFCFAGAVDNTIAFFITFMAQVVLSELALGLFGFLSLANLFLINAALLFIILALTRRHKPSRIWPDMAGFINDIKKDKTLFFILALLAGFSLVKIGKNLLSPPFGWDDLNYHFTFAAEWIKQGNLNIPITVFDDPSPSYYPINGSLVFLWFMLPLRNVFLADLGQVPFFLIAALAVYSIGRKLSLSKRNAFFAAALFTLIPNYFKQMEVAYVDVMVAALFLAALNFLFLLKKRFSFNVVYAFGLSAALLLGTKTVALPYTLLLFFAFFALSLKEGKRGAGAVVLLLVLTAAFGGFAYLRNLIQTGNPLYPLNVNIGSFNIFKGVMSHATYRAHFLSSDYSIGKILFHEGLGAQAIIFIVPALFLALPLARKKNKGLDWFSIYFFILPFLFLLAYRFIIPLANVRYLYVLLGVGMIAGFFSVELLDPPRVILNTLIIITGLASLPEIAKRGELIFALLLSAFFYAFLPAAKRLFSARKDRVFTFCLIAVIILSLKMIEGWYIRNEYFGYARVQKETGFWPDAIEGWRWLNSNTKNSNIAYAGRPVPFPLYGSNLKNNVFYVSVNKTDPVKLHYFPDSFYNWGYDFLTLHKDLESENNYRGRANYSDWFLNLRRRGADFLFIYSLHQTKEVVFPLEDAWAAAHPDSFKPAFANNTVKIYRIAR